MTKSLPLIVSELLETHGPLTRRQINVLLNDGPPEAALRSALRRLEQSESAVKDDSGRYRSLRLYRGGRTPKTPITPDQRETVYALCRGTFRAEIERRTGYGKDVMDRVLNALYRAKRIRFEVDVGWHQRDPDEVPRKKPTRELPIDADHAAWMRYWSPDNRLQRRIEQACC